MTDDRSPEDRKPSGREEVVRALLEAAADLFAESGVDRVSIKGIADRARVNHGLVHRHFGSKEELARKVGELLDEKMRGAVGEPAGLLEAIDRASAVTRGDPRTWRYIARLVLDGDRGFMPAGPGNYLRDLASLAARDQERGALPPAIDPREIVFALAALGLGIELFGEYLAGAIGLPETDIGALEGRCKDYLFRALADERSMTDPETR